MSTLHYISTNRSVVHTEDLHIPAGHDKFSVVSISFPKSYYNVKDGANTFKLDAVTHTVTAGTYDVDTFVDAINTLISPSTISFSTVTGKMTLTSSASSLIFPSGSLLYKHMGFDEASTNAISGTVTSGYVCDLQALSQVYITCSIVTDSSSHDFADLLATFYVNDKGDYTNVVWYNPQIEMTGKAFKFKTHANIFTPTKFTFLDQNGDELELNGGSVHLTCVSWQSDGDLNGIIKDYIGVRLNGMRMEQLKSES
jgi:hypothetical protein